MILFVLNSLHKRHKLNKIKYLGWLNLLLFFLCYNNNRQQPNNNNNNSIHFKQRTVVFIVIPNEFSVWKEGIEQWDFQLMFPPCITAYVVCMAVFLLLEKVLPYLITKRKIIISHLVNGKIIYGRILTLISQRVGVHKSF